MAIFGKEAFDAWPVRGSGEDLIARRIPVGNTIGYEVKLMHSFDRDGNVTSTYFDANVPFEILRTPGFTTLSARLADTINPFRSKTPIGMSWGEVIEKGKIKEHVIFVLEKQSSFDSSKLAKR
ncbi:MAG: hypothetical protein AAB521_04365 [Patescibacteria group bacterium]